MPRKAEIRGRLAEIAALASMRPGLLCPGRAPGRASPPSRRHRFNEAGAFMPRKGEEATVVCEMFSGFNEAGAFMPRKARERRRAIITSTPLQ